MNVDIIYRWRDPECPGGGPRDNKELAFSLESLKYLGEHLGKIYIVARGCSSWSGPKNRDIIWINEDKYDYPPGVPTSSGERSKYILHKLSRLSEYFIVMDADQYFVSDFVLNEWFEGKVPIWPNKIVKAYCPIPLTKTLYKECIFQIKVDEEGGCTLGDFNSKEILKKSINTKEFKEKVKFDPFVVMMPYLEGRGEIISRKKELLVINKDFDKAVKKGVGNAQVVVVKDQWSDDRKEYLTQMEAYDAFRKKLMGY